MSSATRRILYVIYRYHIDRVHALILNDFLQKWTRNSIFSSKSLFADKAGMSKDEIFNYHYNSVWTYTIELT